MSIDSVMKHMRIHREKPYICKICNKGFTVSGNLNKDRRIHPNVKQHICKRNIASRPNNSLGKQFELPSITKSHDLKTGSEVISSPSTRLIPFSAAGDDEKLSRPRRFSRGIALDLSGIADPLRKTRDGEALYASKFKSTVDELRSVTGLHDLKTGSEVKVYLSKTFGCGLCDDLLELEKDFLEHCFRHQFSPPSDLASVLG